MVALRLCFSAVLVFGILSSVAAQAPSETRPSGPSGGHFAFSEVQHDFGRIHDDHPVDWKFPFRNGSGSNVTILHVDTSCGCTTTNVAKKAYEPGASGELIATFNPLTRQGKDKKIITVRTDEPGAKPIELVLLVEVIPRLGVDPPAIFFGDVRFDTVAANPVKRQFTLTSRVPDFAIKSAAIEDPHFALTALPPAAAEADGDKVTLYKYDVTLNSNLPVGGTQGNLRIDTNDPLKVMISIPLIVEAYGDLAVTPSSVGLQLAASGIAVDSFVTVTSRDSKPFHISEAAIVGCETMPLKTSIEPVAPKSEIGWRIHVTGTSPEGGTKILGTLKLKTDRASQPEVDIPIKGYVLRKQQVH